MPRNELALMLQAARLYYEDNRTQAQIARALKTSRPTVSRLLQQARQEGIVQIKIIDPNSTHSILEEQLLATFPLVEAVVVSIESEAVDVTRHRIGQAAARYLERTLQNGDRVGIGWGRTLSEMVNALQPRRPARLQIIPLIGGLGQIAPAFQVHELARLMAEAFGATWQNFYVPALVESDRIAATLLRSADVRQVAAQWQSLDVAIVGIGNVAFETDLQMLFADYLAPETQTRLRTARAVGDICVRFFDAQGKPCANVIRGVVGIELKQLKRARRSIGIAGGAEKAEAILGALRGRYINVLVTDEAAARRVLELHRESTR
jgi:DNA-binding transcriptional regulator LsrR (DeoR family)